MAPVSGAEVLFKRCVGGAIILLLPTLSYGLKLVVKGSQSCESRMILSYEMSILVVWVLV